MAKIRAKTKRFTEGGFTSGFGQGMNTGMQLGSAAARAVNSVRGSGASAKKKSAGQADETVAARKGGFIAGKGKR